MVNADQSRTLHVSPRNQPPSLANVSMKQLDSPLMSRGVLPTQVYARQNVQKFPKQVHVAAVPNGHGGQSATNQNMSSSQQLQTGRLPFQLSQQRIFQQHQHSPLQDQAVVLQGNPKQLDEQIALAERQTEENRRNLLRYSPFPAQTQHVPHNANIKQLQTAKQKQDNGLKPAGYNLNKVQIPIKVRDNVITPSPQSNTDVKLVNRTGAPNRTIQQTNSQVMVSNKRRKLCVKQESQNPAFSQSTCFQQIGNQNIPVIKGSNPASANMCQTIQTKQNGKTHPQNNSFTDCEVTPGTVERVELKGGGKFEEGQIYMVRNRKGQEIKMIWKGGELVNFKSTVIPG